LIFTVGHAESYRRGIAELATRNEHLQKLGPRPADGTSPAYHGGFAVETRADGERLINEFGKRGEWDVFALDAEWNIDTKPSLDGWWHNLQRDAVIVDLVTSGARQP